MIIIPAITILDGKVASVQGGDFSTAKFYDVNPFELAEKYSEEGAIWTHIVDLDGAREGRLVNYKIISDIMQDVDIRVEVAGGIRNLDDVEAYIRMGAGRVVVTPSALQAPEDFLELTGTYGGRVLANFVEANNKVWGWGHSEERDWCEFGIELAKLRTFRMVYTDATRDGMLCGVDAEKVQQFSDAVDFALTVCGGVASLDDLTALHNLTSRVCDGAIVNRALLEGKFELSEAVAHLDKLLEIQNATTSACPSVEGMMDRLKDI